MRLIAAMSVVFIYHNLWICHVDFNKAGKICLPQSLNLQLLLFSKDSLCPFYRFIHNFHKCQSHQNVRVAYHLFCGILLRGFAQCFGPGWALNCVSECFKLLGFKGLHQKSASNINNFSQGACTLINSSDSPTYTLQNSQHAIHMAPHCNTHKGDFTPFTCAWKWGVNTSTCFT